MVTISISELKKFLNAAKSIKDNKILPILSYVKLICKDNSAQLIKTNLNSFVITDIEADFKKDVTILIEEQTLSGCVNYSRGESVKISVVGKNVVMNDGHREVKCQLVEDVYPVVETNEGHKKVSLNIDVISSMSLAKSHTLSSAGNSVREWKCFVHITKVAKKSYVVGVNGAVSYFKSFKEDLPTISLDPETVAIVSRFPVVDYSSNDRYDYFQHLGTTYGFIKTETACPAFDTVLEKFKSENSFVLKRKELIDFCDMVINLNGTAVPPEVSIVNNGKNKLLLSFSDLSGNQTATEEITVESKTFEVEPILFQPKNVLIAMKDLGVEKIKVSKIFGNMIISSDEEKDYTGSIMELARVQN